MTVDEAMRFFCAYHGVAPRYDLLERLGLASKRQSQYRELSTGQQRRLALALAVAHNPPRRHPGRADGRAGRRLAHRAARADGGAARTAGRRSSCATHDMAEAEKMADRVAILLRGKIVATGTPRELTAAGAGLTKVSVRTEESCLATGWRAFPAVSQKLFKEDYAIYYSTDPGPTVSAILDSIGAHDDKLIDLRVERPSLEERFLEITDRRRPMTAFVDHFAFEFKTGLRNATLLMMNYLFPLGFYVMMGLVMTQINPLVHGDDDPGHGHLRRDGQQLLGLPGPLVEQREAGIFRSYKINGVPALSILRIPVLTHHASTR